MRKKWRYLANCVNQNSSSKHTDVLQMPLRSPIAFTTKRSCGTPQIVKNISYLRFDNSFVIPGFNITGAWRDSSETSLYRLLEDSSFGANSSAKSIVCIMSSNSPEEILPKNIPERKNQYARIGNLVEPGYLARHYNTPSTLAPKLDCNVVENHIELGPLSR